MIKYKDFTPQFVQKNSLWGSGKVEAFSKTVIAANEWIQGQSIHVMNVETVIMPGNLPNAQNNTDTDTSLSSTSQYGGVYLQFMRVWYVEKETPQ